MLPLLPAMTPSPANGIRSTLSGWLLLLFAALVSLTGNGVAFELKHAHEEGHHPHEHQGSIEARDSEAPSDHDDHDSGGDMHHHHIVTTGVPSFFVDIFPVGPPLPQVSLMDRTFVSDSCPDGPFFDLIKPPQIGC